MNPPIRIAVDRTLVPEFLKISQSPANGVVFYVAQFDPFRAVAIAAMINAVRVGKNDPDRALAAGAVPNIRVI